MNKLKTKALFFDFDGTLTIGRSSNVWKMIYVALGYNTGEGSSYKKSYLNFVEGRCTYADWVEINKHDFQNAGLTKNIFDEVLTDLTFIDGIEETLKVLTEAGVKLFIVSGNMNYAITKALGSMLKYFTEISANFISFDEDGKLDKMIATSYDYEGKADYIFKVQKEYNILPQEMVFVGNGPNDIWAYKSGVKTICINPKDAEENDAKIWNIVLTGVTNLTEILKYID